MTQTQLFLALIFLIFVSSISFAQEKPTLTKIGIVNGRATSLPKPIHPQELKELCADGKVEIEVLIGNDGGVLEAKAVSGDELLFDSASEAARNAKFSRVRTEPPNLRGIIVYNFTRDQKCFDAGVVNKKAISIPKFPIHDHAKITKETEIKVRIVINESGDVVAAKALTGHPAIRAAAEAAARRAKFPPTLINGPGFRVEAIIIYKIKPDRTVEI